jgi:hypothetical protein
MADSKQFALVVWNAADLHVFRPDWTVSQCNEWFEQNQKHIQDRLVEVGWSVIEDLLGTDEETEVE